MDAALGMAIFILVFIVIPWGLIFALRLVSRRRGYDNLHAPSQEGRLADRPLRCRLNLFHRWRSMRTPPATATSAAWTAARPATSHPSRRHSRCASDGWTADNNGQQRSSTAHRNCSSPTL
jgi:hypothetical protein